MNTQKSNALPIAMMYALFFMIAFVTNLQIPFANVVRDQFSLSNFQSVLGNAANFIAYAMMGIPSGLLLRRYGYKSTALIAVATGFTGVGITLISGFMGSFPVYITGALVSGFSMCLLNVVVNPMLNTLGSTEKKGNQLLLFGGAINSAGGTIAPILAGILAGSAVREAGIKDVSPALYLGMSIFLVTFIVLSFVSIPEPHIQKEKLKEKIKEKSKYSALSFRHFNFGIAAIFLYVGIEVGIPIIASNYMEADIIPEPGQPAGLGLSKGLAGTMVGIYWFLMLIGRLTGGIIASKISSKKMLASASSVIILLVILGMVVPKDIGVDLRNISFINAEIPLGILFFTLCGLFTSVMWPNIFNLATSGLGKYTAMASGYFMVMVCGGGILPAIQGAIADQTTYITSYFLVIAAVSFILFYALAGSKNVNKDIDTSIEPVTT